MAIDIVKNSLYYSFLYRTIVWTKMEDGKMESNLLDLMGEMSRQGEKIAITACSDEMNEGFRQQLPLLLGAIEKMGLTAVLSDYLFINEAENATRTGADRARELMSFYKDADIKDIFDVSGGDLSNEILPYLSYEHIRNSRKTFWGYSDLTAVCNAIYVKTGKISVLYQIRNLIRSNAEMQQRDFFSTYLLGDEHLFRVPVSMVQKEHMEGIIVGGNIRCFLKLAGTEYFPDLTGKLLLLESRSAEEYQIRAMLAQLNQLGAFEKISGLILGDFTYLAERHPEVAVDELVKPYVRADLPIAKTDRIGHKSDSMAVYIGKKARIEGGVITYPSVSHNGREMTEEEKNNYDQMVTDAEQMSIFDLWG